MNKYIAVLLGALTLGGCALSPQEVEVNPRVMVEKSQQALDGVVSVTVYDERISDSIGSRGGVYSETNVITTKPRLPLSIRSAVELALREMGLKVTDSVDVSQFQIYLDRLEYSVPEGGYVTQVDLKASIRLVVAKGGDRFEGRYSSDITERVAKAPSDDKNEELINKVVSDVLGRALSDPELVRYLSVL